MEEEQKCDDTSCEFNENGICRAGVDEHCGEYEYEGHFRANIHGEII